MEFDPRTTALGIARGRVVLGITMLVLPGLAGRVAFGATSREGRTLLRMLGAREIVLGVGAITAVKEHTQDAEWVGMGAVSDAVDVAALLMAPGPPVRRALNAFTAASGAATGMLCARMMADERKALAPADD